MLSSDKVYEQKKGGLINMKQSIKFDEQDSIAVIAPHPDDECLCASAALLMAADRTDIFVTH